MQGFGGLSGSGPHQKPQGMTAAPPQCKSAKALAGLILCIQVDFRDFRVLSGYKNRNLVKTRGTTKTSLKKNVLLLFLKKLYQEAG